MGNEVIDGSEALVTFVTLCRLDLEQIIESQRFGFTGWSMFSLDMSTEIGFGLECFAAEGAHFFKVVLL